MRLTIFLALLPLPAVSWEFSPDPICTLSHQAADALIEVTYDAALPEYALHITKQDGPWRAAPTFGIAFQGGGPAFSIGTDRHSLSADGRTLTVRDRGFGNVLDGIEFNAALTASSGPVRVAADTSDAAAAVRAFRACPSDVPATS